MYGARAKRKTKQLVSFQKKWCKLAGKDKLRVNINKWP